jgi:hypothetical protein
MLNFLKKTSRQKLKKQHYPIVPSGLIAKTEKGFFYIKGNKRFKFISNRAMSSWSLPVVETSESMLVNYPLAGILGFRDGALIKDISDGKIYLISDSKRRHIIDPDILEWLNVEIITVGQKELFVHSEGEKL